MKNLINTKSTPDIKPDNSGEINQEATVLKKKTDRKEHEIYSIIYMYNSQEARVNEQCIQNCSCRTGMFQIFTYNWRSSISTDIPESQATARHY